MIRFLLKGLLRDRHRSLFPIIIVSAGAAMTVYLYCFMHGFMDDTIRSNAKLDTGHLKVMTKGYEEIADQLPNDLALRDSDALLEKLSARYPRLDWMARIRFGGLLDIPDEVGETRSQGPVFGMAMDLLGEDSKDLKYLELEKAIVRGRLPVNPGEILVSDDFAVNLAAGIGETATLISSTANGSMAIHNFTIAGTIRFGMDALDRNSMIADISDIRYALDMDEAAGEILGIFHNMIYDENLSARIASDFNSIREENGGDFTPVMLTLGDQGGLGELLESAEYRIGIVLVTFITIMSLVLWNAGLMSGIRRYGEIGVRLAIGESKDRVYRYMIYESLLIGLIGTVIGTALGLAVSLYLQEVGIDYSGMMKGNEVVMANVVRSKITKGSYFIGFIPGMMATLLGSVFSGIGIFRRETARLFKELEV